MHSDHDASLRLPQTSHSGGGLLLLPLLSLWLVSPESLECVEPVDVTFSGPDPALPTQS